jgi:hypothetical protein
MQTTMSPNEYSTLGSFMKKAKTYVEWGCGDSTVLAASVDVPNIISTDSSLNWIEKTKHRCEEYKYQPKFIHIDIGKLGKWGTPIDESKKDYWPRYCTYVWQDHRSINADLYLIDGRFRVACFAQIYRYCTGNSIIAVHDFASRQKHYSVIHEIGREIFSIEDLSFFVVQRHKLDLAYKILREYQYDYK